jgi:hypothetical protein
LLQNLHGKRALVVSSRPFKKKGPLNQRDKFRQGREMHEAQGHFLNRQTSKIRQFCSSNPPFGGWGGFATGANPVVSQKQIMLTAKKQDLLTASDSVREFFPLYSGGRPEGKGG